MARLGDICKLIADGDWIESKDQANDGIRLIQTGNIGIGKFLDKSSKSKYISSETFNRLKCTEVFAGDILISRLPDPVGRACMVPANIGKAITAVDCTIIRLNDSCISSYFLNYTQSDRYYNELQTFLAGTTRTRISRKNLEKIEIPLPSLDEQRRIAATLDKVTDLIAKRRQQLDKLDELVKARFAEQFNHYTQFKKLEELATLITKGSSPKWQGIDYTDSGTLFVTSENVQTGFLDFKKRKYLDNRINEIQPRSILHRNDVLINIVGASIGRAAIFDCDELANINQAVALVRIDLKRTNLKFLITYFNSPAAMDIYTKMKKGGARDNLSLRNIADLPIPVVPLEAQDQFADFIDQTENVKITINRSLEKLETLKKALMQEYFG